MTTISDFTLPLLNGTSQPLAAYAGKVVLVVNTASKCGFTPQYEGLEQLWREHGDDGLVVLGFPCNQFGSQEPGAADEIAEFCSINYGVSFPIFAKVDVNGPDETPLYSWLKSSAPGIFGTEAVKWNFTKFLIGRDGLVAERFGPDIEPSAIAPAIARLL